MPKGRKGRTLKEPESNNSHTNPVSNSGVAAAKEVNKVPAAGVNPQEKVWEKAARTTIKEAATVGSSLGGTRTGTTSPGSSRRAASNNRAPGTAIAPAAAARTTCSWTAGGTHEEGTTNRTGK